MDRIEVLSTLDTGSLLLLFINIVRLIFTYNLLYSIYIVDDPKKDFNSVKIVSVQRLTYIWL